MNKIRYTKFAAEHCFYSLCLVFLGITNWFFYFGNKEGEKSYIIVISGRIDSPELAYYKKIRISRQI